MMLTLLTLPLGLVCAPTGSGQPRMAWLLQPVTRGFPAERLGVTGLDCSFGRTSWRTHMSC
jgi:hypothetical protein